MKRDKLKENLMKLGGVAFLIYILFLVGKVIYQNIKFNGVEKDLQKQVDVLDVENANLKNQILYYQTDSYKERVMRERLGYQKPGEKVLVITAPNEDGKKSQKPQKPKISNFQKWMSFLFPPKQED